MDRPDIRHPGQAFATRLRRAVRRFLTSPPYRESLRMRILGRTGAFQPTNQTRQNRYPVIMRFVRETLGADRELRLLSFGCSTGEEVFALRRNFPFAHIKGIDINAGNIAACGKALRRRPDARIVFATGSSTVGEPAGAYDAIFCMAVLRDGRLAQTRALRCDPILHFADFARTVADFHRCLKPGGLLVIRFSNFRLCDAPAGAQFEPILSLDLVNPSATPIFGPDNRLMPGVRYPDTVFRRIA